jgi:hypothetical protein
MSGKKKMESNISQNICQPILSSPPSANHQIVLEILINSLFRDEIRTNLHPIL